MIWQSAPLLAGVLAVALVTAPALGQWSPRILWNSTASVPVGLYWLEPVDRVAIGDLVAVQPPEGLVHFLAERGYLPQGVPLLKHVVALPGAEVCRDGAVIRINGQVLGLAAARDRLGRALPDWQGCHQLAVGEVFLMNPAVPDSLDGRYFGPLPLGAITARLQPIWIPRAHSAPPGPTDRAP
ncbi:MAG: S26 family signal peptidase [Pararhodobacter sp.]|nr:S26 family signal peptidase [Pararhodobacter sp.]